MREVGRRVFGLGLACILATAAAQGAESAGRTLMRYPTLYGNTIVFVAHDNLWSVPRGGGGATQLNADEGRKRWPGQTPDIQLRYRRGSTAVLGTQQ